MKRYVQGIIDSPEIAFAATYGTAVSLVPKQPRAGLSRARAVPRISEPPEGDYPVSRVPERAFARVRHVENRPCRHIVLLCLDLESGTLTTSSATS